MSTSSTPSTYRRRLGRAPSPPTWLWYEQIPYDDDSSCSDEDRSDCDDYDDQDDRSCSEDDEDYTHTHGSGVGNPVAPASESGSNTDSGESGNGNGTGVASHVRDDGLSEIMGEDIADRKGAGGDTVKKDLKGKQRAVEPETDKPPQRRERERRRKREPVITLRPILTIQKSQGFVWNQVRVLSAVLQVHRISSISDTSSHSSLSLGSFCSSIHQRPLYVTMLLLRVSKKLTTSWRYSFLSFYGIYNMTSRRCGFTPSDIASTSPPNASGCCATPASSYNPMNDYEVDVVEIRVKEGEYADIIP